MEEVDDDEVLASWKTLDVPDDDDNEPNDSGHDGHEHHHRHHAMHGGSSIATETDDDVEDDFAALAYAHHARMEAVQEPSQHQQHAFVQLSTSDHEQHHNSDAARLHTHTHTHAQRLKRKNFSKKLQLLCLQRYAQFAKTHGKLPDKTECQCLLHQSYLEFLKAGGAPDEPRLSHQEFLKLIRNRRREMYVRAHKLGHSVGAASASAASAAGKRKLQHEHAKIYELIELIDQAREQSGLTASSGSEHHHHHSRHHFHTNAGRQQSPAQRRGVQHSARSPHGVPHAISASSSPSQLPQPPSAVATAPAPSPPPPPKQPLPMDPQEQLLAIFELQQETLAVQREIAERLKAIRDHRHLHDPMEPSSASV